MGSNDGRCQMAKNKTTGDNQRKGAVKTRTQIKNPITGTWTKRDDKSGEFLREASKRFEDTMKRLAKR